MNKRATRSMERRGIVATVSRMTPADFHDGNILLSVIRVRVKKLGYSWEHVLRAAEKACPFSTKMKLPRTVRRAARAA